MHHCPSLFVMPVSDSLDMKGSCMSDSSQNFFLPSYEDKFEDWLLLDLHETWRQVYHISQRTHAYG